jgi:cell division protein FtsI (penicillin-binding protein 3)
MGYQISVTPLQIVAAFGAIANGGQYVEPRVVRAAYRDGRRIAVTSRIVRRTISGETAATLTRIMEGVVQDDRGTATRARIPGYTIAGKTGTAEKLINGRYSPYLNNVSFAGFLPSRNPELAIIVMVDSPTAGGKTGGVIAAPVFQRIAEAAVRARGVAPSINPGPSILVARADQPAAVPTSAVVALPAPPVVQAPPGTMPDLSGMSLREANQRLARLGLPVHTTGSGIVVSQSPLPGTPIESGMRLRVVLDRVVVRNTTDTGGNR